MAAVAAGYTRRAQSDASGSHEQAAVVDGQIELDFDPAARAHPIDEPTAGDPHRVSHLAGSGQKGECPHAMQHAAGSRHVANSEGHVITVLGEGYVPSAEQREQRSQQRGSQSSLFEDPVAYPFVPFGDRAEVAAQPRVEFREAVAQNAFVHRSTGARDRGIRSLSEHVQKCSTLGA